MNTKRSAARFHKCRGLRGVNAKRASLNWIIIYTTARKGMWALRTETDGFIIRHCPFCGIRFA